MKRITRIIRPIICMAVLLFAMTTAVMGCYQKETGPIDIPGRTPSGTSAPQPSATPAGEVIPLVDRQAELAEARAKNPDTVAWLYTKQSYKSKKKIWDDPENGVIFENTQPPIIEESVFLIVQNIRKARRRPIKMGEMDMFSGLLYCADCGGKMYQCRATNFAENQNTSFAPPTARARI